MKKEKRIVVELFLPYLEISLADKKLTADKRIFEKFALIVEISIISLLNFFFSQPASIYINRITTFGILSNNFKMVSFIHQYR